MKSALDNLVDYNVLWLGRHVALSTHQVKYGHQIAGALTEDLDFIGDKPKPGRISNIIFAVTSGNQHLLRDNPIGFADRIVPLNDLGRLLEDNYDVTYSVVSIPHFPQIHNWPEVVTKIVSRHYGLGDKPFFNPDNMIFLGSTPAIVRLFQMEGYSVLGSELISLQPEPKYCARNPWDILMEAIKIPNINKIPDLSSYTKRWWASNTKILNDAKKLFADPLMGGLTSTRDYFSYGWDMSNPAVMQSKYDSLDKFLFPGKIVDEGCSDGALLAVISREFHKKYTDQQLADISLYGVDISTEFFNRCLSKRQSGAFGKILAYFDLANIMNIESGPGKRDITICNSTLHELWSYGEQEETLGEYFNLKYGQTNDNGRLIIRDVLAPDNPDDEIYLLVNHEDGSNEDWNKQFSTEDRVALQGHLENLSTHARFKRFAVDYLASVRDVKRRGPETQIQYEENEIDGQTYIITKRKWAAEFMIRKDWTDSWYSEMNEEFSFWTHDQWKAELEDSGWSLIVNEEHPELGSRAYVDHWKIKDWIGSVEMFELVNGDLVKAELPYTNQILIAEKIK